VNLTNQSNQKCRNVLMFIPSKLAALCPLSRGKTRLDCGAGGTVPLADDSGPSSAEFLHAY